MRTLRSPGGLLALLLAGIVSLPAADAGAASSPPPAAVVPGAEWTRAEDVARHGLNAARLAALTPFLQSLDTTAMMVVVDGRVVFDYGDLARVSYLASGRKSVLSLLYGNAVASGAVRLNQTLAELGYTDVESMAGGFGRWKDEGRAWTTPATLTPEQTNRYKRHLLLPEVGVEGQTKLLGAKVLMLGAGVNFQLTEHSAT